MIQNHNKRIISTFLFIVLLSSLVAAAPNIQILSPQNTNYASHKILLNVTSNETVDFFMKGARNNNRVIAKNVTNYESFLYGKIGEFNFSINANNSDGVDSESVVYNITLTDNPINITDNGFLTSPNTEYRIVNNLSSGYLFWSEGTYNIDLNLNGFTIYALSNAINAQCFFSKIYNGTIKVITTGLWDTGLTLDTSDSCLFKDLSIETNGVGVIFMTGADRIKFENVNIKAPYGVVNYNNFLTVAEFKNVTITGTGGGAAFRHLTSLSDTYTLEEVVVSNYSKDISIEDYASRVEYVLRSSTINTSGTKEGFTNWEQRYGITRLLKQHKVIINLTDQNGNPISGAVEIVENNFNPNQEIQTIDHNPTAQVFIGTNAAGVGETFLTEEIEVITSFSPMVSEKKKFDPYNLTARSKGVSADRIINFSATNSTIRVGISFTFQEVPQCTILQMLDLNNDGVVDTQDALFIIRQKIGHAVSFNSTKNCQGINLNPF